MPTSKTMKWFPTLCIFFAGLVLWAGILEGLYVTG